MRLTATSQRILPSLIAFVLLFASSPTIVFAEEVPVDPGQSTTEPTTPVPPSEPSPENTQPPVAPIVEAPSTVGPQQPTGADSPTYTYDETTGLWGNGTYTWDPATQQTKPIEAPTYSYNPTTGRWDTTEWVYDAPSGKYIENIVSVPNPPANATIVEKSGAEPSSSEHGSPSEVNNRPPAQHTANDLAPSNTSQPQSHGIFDLFYNASISNSLTSLAHSGDALTALNTLAGSAMSGSATALATLINLMQSSWNMLAGSFSTFTQNLFGDLFGDLTLSPPSPQPNATALPDDLTVRISENAAIDNTVKLDATSGNAGVTNNTAAGSASTGDATAIANIINAINSSIAANQSFIGMLNIFGNLDGDILLPKNLIPTLLASNMLSTLDTSNIENSSVLGQFNNSQSIVNNVDLDAASGSADVSNNTSAGNATTGKASTNLTVLNLTGREVVGSNALLVFVNVLGKWVGVIVDAPTGTTAAALGTGISANKSLDIGSTSNQKITNNVDASALSGDASVTNNTSAGNATSGNAHAGANILNLTGSQLSLSNWFGVLFINVFGTWNGSFGVDTAAGNTPVAPIAQINNSQAAASLPVTAVKVYRFAPTTHGNYQLQQSDDATSAVLAEAIATPGADKKTAASPTHNSDIAQNQSDWMFTAIGIVVAASLLGTERVLARRQTLTK